MGKCFLNQIFSGPPNCLHPGWVIQGAHVGFGIGAAEIGHHFPERFTESFRVGNGLHDAGITAFGVAQNQGVSGKPDPLGEPAQGFFIRYLSASEIGFGGEVAPKNFQPVFRVQQQHQFIARKHKS